MRSRATYDEANFLCPMSGRKCLTATNCKNGCAYDGSPTLPLPSATRRSTLRELSEKATPGPISLNSKNRLRVLTSMDHPMCEFSEAYHRLAEHGEGADPEFMVALWNAYRNGELIESQSGEFMVAEDFWKQIRDAAAQSPWMPPDYVMNDWVADVCAFLRGPSNPPSSTREFDNPPIIGYVNMPYLDEEGVRVIGVKIRINDWVKWIGSRTDAEAPIGWLMSKIKNTPSAIERMGCDRIDGLCPTPIACKDYGKRCRGER